jgi:hypothetical protein
MRAMEPLTVITQRTYEILALLASNADARIERGLGRWELFGAHVESKNLKTLKAYKLVEPCGALWDAPMKLTDAGLDLLRRAHQLKAGRWTLTPSLEFGRAAV